MILHLDIFLPMSCLQRTASESSGHSKFYLVTLCCYVVYSERGTTMFSQPPTRSYCLGRYRDNALDLGGEAEA